MSETNRTPLTEQVVRDMRLACRKSGGGDYMIRRAHITRNPHTWWYSNEHWSLDIHCKHNAHGEYMIDLSKASDFWFCFLKNGQHSHTFLHLRHIKYLDELQAIVRALTELELCETEGSAKAWLDEHPVPYT